MKPAVIAKMCGTKIKYPTAKGDDVMTQVTDAMVEAACNKEFELVQHWPLRGEERFVYMNKPNMRAVLTAALSAAEPPGAPGDAEFRQLVRDYGTSSWDYGDGGSTTEQELEAELDHILDMHRHARMAGLRALRAEIDELTKPYLDKPLVTDPSDPDLVEFNSYRAIAFRIDAMLQGADGEGEQ